MASCFVATAVYGTENCDEVRLLQHFRDRVLLKRSFGVPLVRRYYRYAPRLAKIVERRPWLKATARAVFDAIIAVLRRTAHRWAD